MFKKDLDKVVDKCMEKANCIDDKNCENDCEKDSEKKREDLLEKAVAKALECKQTCQSNTLGGESGVIVHQQIKPRRSSPFEIELELLFPQLTEESQDKETVLFMCDFIDIKVNNSLLQCCTNEANAWFHTLTYFIIC